MRRRQRRAAAPASNHYSQHESRRRRCAMNSINYRVSNDNRRGRAVVRRWDDDDGTNTSTSRSSLSWRQCTDLYGLAASSWLAAWCQRPASTRTTRPTSSVARKSCTSGRRCCANTGEHIWLSPCLVRRPPRARRGWPKMWTGNDRPRLLYARRVFRASDVGGQKLSNKQLRSF